MVAVNREVTGWQLRACWSVEGVGRSALRYPCRDLAPLAAKVSGQVVSLCRCPKGAPLGISLWAPEGKKKGFPVELTGREALDGPGRPPALDAQHSRRC